MMILGTQQNPTIPIQQQWYVLTQDPGHQEEHDVVILNGSQIRYGHILSNHCYTAFSHHVTGDLLPQEQHFHCVLLSVNN